MWSGPFGTRPMFGERRKCILKSDNCFEAVLASDWLNTCRNELARTGQVFCSAMHDKQLGDEKHRCGLANRIPLCWRVFSSCFIHVATLLTLSFAPAPHPNDFFSSCFLNVEQSANLQPWDAALWATWLLGTDPCVLMMWLRSLSAPWLIFDTPDAQHCISCMLSLVKTPRPVGFYQLPDMSCNAKCLRCILSVLLVL